MNDPNAPNAPNEYDFPMSGTAPILLLSMPQMADPNFARSVVLLCDYTEKGAFGIVVNRQMDEPAWTMVKTDPPVKVDPEVRLWVGGPVEPEQTWVLSTHAQGPDDERREICPGIVLSMSHQLALRLLQEPPTNRARIVVGCSAWAPSQLDEELAASAWLTMEVDPALIFSVPPELMWETALRRLGTDPAMLQTSFGVH
jgi:putative transcriptional regulator